MAPSSPGHNRPLVPRVERLARGVHDYHFPGGLAVSLEHYRSGLDVFFQGSLRGAVVGSCARCAEEYSFQLDHAFALVLVPRAANVEPATKLAVDDLALSTYDRDEIDLTPLLHEQTMLALPTRPLCRETCLGLCARCGANLNAGPCGCPAVPGEPRLAVLRELIRGR
jgi:uncharacterized protein